MNNSSNNVIAIDHFYADEKCPNVINFYADKDDLDPMVCIEREDCKCAQEKLRTHRFSSGSPKRTDPFEDYNFEEMFRMHNDIDDWESDTWFEYAEDSIEIHLSLTIFYTIEIEDEGRTIHCDDTDEFTISIPYDEFMNFEF